MKFAEKNDWTIRLKNEKHFDKDKKLYYKHFPKSSLKEQIEKANDFTKKRLSEKMIFELLSVVSPDVILKNRSSKKNIEKSVDGNSIKDNELQDENENQENIKDAELKYTADNTGAIPAIFQKPENSKKKEEKKNFPE